MIRLYRKLRCWIWGHVWFIDGPSAEAQCVYCGEEPKWQ